MENQDFSKFTTIIGEIPGECSCDCYVGEDRRLSLRDVFLDDDDFEDAEVYYPSKMNDKSLSGLVEKEVEQNKNVQPFLLDKTNTASSSLATPGEFEEKPFIVANTTEVTLEHLKSDCIIPVFSKDNEKTVAHSEFIESVMDAVYKMYPFETIAEPEIRVSHQIKGRTPDAIHLNAKDLEDHQKTIYYERMAFMVKIPSITQEVNGNKLSLCVGGVRSYNQQNLYSMKAMEKFKFFVGFQNWVCMNLCVNTDGFKEDLRVSNATELYSKALETMKAYNAELHLMEMKELTYDTCCAFRN